MAEKFDFWQDHSEQFLIMANLWDRRMVPENYAGTGRKTGDCGDTITMYLGVREGSVAWLNFELDGCMNTNACSNAVAVLVEGKSIEQCWQVTPNDVIDFLSTLPVDHHHCAELAVGTLYLALADWAKKSSAKTAVDEAQG